MACSPPPAFLMESPHLRTVLLLAIVIWSFCRFYYYLFYVLERYLGKNRPYAGIFDALRFIVKKALITKYHQAMKHLLVPALVITTLLGLTGCPSIPDHPQATFSTQENNTIVHTYSKVVFPNKIGPFIRDGVRVYDQAGLDVSVAYHCPAPISITATVYSFPSPKLTSIGSPPDVIQVAREHLTANYFNDVKQEIVRVHPNAVEIQSRAISGPESTIGKYAEYKLRESFWGQIQDLGSRLYLFTYFKEKWTVEYRFTYPTSPDAEKAVDEFVKAYQWTTNSIEQKK
ncbi:MAG TPA: hypothetical protein VL357_03630 [Rariglobus sp.]|nr:hypothetical protein [Rariglobus sp.]